MSPLSHVYAGLFAAAPVVLVFLMSYALSPRIDQVSGASRRPAGSGADRAASGMDYTDTSMGRVVLAVVRATLALGAFAVLTVEIAASFQLLTATVIRICWLTATIVVAGLVAAVAYRRRRRSRADRERQAAVKLARRMPTGWLNRSLAGALVVLVLGELLMALLAEPNNFDSQTYHLPRVEHWVLNRDVDPYPTAIHRQVTLAPGAEYLLLHLRLLTGGDALYHLPQWAAGVLCLLVAARIVAQLGGGPRAQLIAAFLVGTTPMVVTQSTSTQNDLLVAAWTACVATLALDGLTRRAGPGEVLALGTALGLTAVTKNSGLLAAGPLLLLWAVGQLRLVWLDRARVRRVGAILAAGAGVLAVAAVLVGPFVGRMTVEFGHPLGPPRLRESIPMQRHDPAAVLVNALRIGHTALDTPVAPVRRGTARAIAEIADALGVDPQDRATTFGQTTFPVPAWYPDEDRVAFPISGALALIATMIALIQPRRVVTGDRSAPQGWKTIWPEFAVRGYALIPATAMALYAGTIKWQPWGNRLLLFALVLATPLAGLWLDAVCRRSGDQRSAPHLGGRRAASRSRLAVTVLSVAALAAALTLAYGFPRRLVGTGSVLTSSDWETRFVRRPQWAEEFQWAAKAVDEAGARRIGLVQQNDNWEYPWWLLLRDHEIVSLRSVVPHHPPARPAEVDAIVCTGKQKACQAFVPPGWLLRYRGYVGYALPQP